MKPSFLIAGIGLALAIIFGLQYWQQRQAPSTPTTPTAEPVASQPVAPESVELKEPAQTTQVLDTEPLLPALDDSDDYVRELLDPQVLPAGWLEPEQLLRRVATLLDNAATGGLPRGQLGFLAPEGSFLVTPAGKQFRVDPQSYARFDPLVSALEAIEAQTLAGWYRRLEPLLSKALAELGQSQSPDSLLAQAIAEVASVPRLGEDVLLVQPNLLYQYQDPALEKLGPLHKQLLRMGPDNLTRIQGYLVELAGLLGLELPEPPQG